MPFTPPDAILAASLRAVIADPTDLETHRGRETNGSEWLTVTWQGGEIIMQRNALGGPWEAFDPAVNDAIGTGLTPADALRAALAHD